VRKLLFRGCAERAGSAFAEGGKSGLRTGEKPDPEGLKALRDRGFFVIFVNQLIYSESPGFAGFLPCEYEYRKRSSFSAEHCNE
jgi:hypothetical protein